MAFLKNAKASGKKPASMPGPKSAAYKKLAAAKKNEKSEARKKKKPRAAVVSLKAKQALVERIKRKIWDSLQEINDAILLLAKAGNCTAAKALYDFAGVYSLPAPQDGNAEAKAAPVPVPVLPANAVAEAELDPVEGFFRSIGVEPPNPELEPELVAAG